MDNLVGAFAHLCTQHKDAVSPDGVDVKRKTSAHKSFSITVLWRILKSSADMAIMTAVRSVAENPHLGGKGSRDYVAVNSKAISHCHYKVKQE